MHTFKLYIVSENDKFVEKCTAEGLSAFCCSRMHKPVVIRTRLELYTVKPVLSDHRKQDVFLAFQTGGCLLLHESRTESSYLSICYFHSAISKHPCIAISMSPQWVVAYNRFNTKGTSRLIRPMKDPRYVQLY